MKKLIAIMLVIIIFSVAGCQCYEFNPTHAWGAVSFAEDFCLALSEDIELAKEFLHPDSTPSKDNLSTFIEEIEQKNDILFSNGVALKEVKGFEFEPESNNSSISVYKFSLKIVVGIRPINLSFSVRMDDNGYSIMHIEQREWVAES